VVLPLQTGLKLKQAIKADREGAAMLENDRKAMRFLRSRLADHRVMLDTRLNIATSAVAESEALMLGYIERLSFALQMAGIRSGASGLLQWAATSVSRISIEKQDDVGHIDNGQLPGTALAPSIRDLLLEQRMWERQERRRQKAATAMAQLLSRKKSPSWNDGVGFFGAPPLPHKLLPRLPNTTTNVARRHQNRLALAAERIEQ
jgi:hypothetical protein